MALHHTNRKINTQAYLANERCSETRHELIDGDVYAMAGTSKNHEKIVMNIANQLYNHLADTPCAVFSSNVKVKVEDSFFYPDVMVVCDDTAEDDYYTESPVIIIEVLSKSTRRTDKVLKRRAYQTLPSLQTYMLIEQDLVEVEVARRDNHWLSEHYFLGDDINLNNIDLQLAVTAMYARVDNAEMLEWRTKLEDAG